MKKILKSKKWLGLVFMGIILTACAPGPPPPPVFPGFEWMMVALLIIVAGVLLWRKLDVSHPKQEDHLSEVLNDIHRQLKKMEKKIEELEKKMPKDKKTEK